jgi:hypothetical protein
MHCRQFQRTPINRRDLLKASGFGFGAFAFDALSGEVHGRQTADRTHHKAKAKNVIFLYMDGGVSHVDSFDPKPALKEHNGKNPADFFKVSPTQFNNNGKILASPWNFKEYGKSGIVVSDLFPHIAQHVDDLAVVRSMTSNFSEHTNANYFLHTGSGLQGRPSMGAWVTYGLGSESKDLPGFVVVNGGLTPPGGLDNFNSGFLPASYQGSVFKPGGSAPVANISRRERDPQTQRSKLDLLAKLDAVGAERSGGQDAIESAIANYEMAFRMQSSVPELTDLSGESEQLKELYGMNHKYDKTRIFASECLMARRLVERGVRFVELTCPNTGNDRWDAHSNLKKNHENNALAVDQPIAALLTDLKQRGMLQETLVIWAGEFGRTPFAQGSNGRDHHPFAYSIWMAGGGAKGGTIYGKTDQFGYHVIEGKLEMHDMHATMLHLLGIDHERSTYRFSGRDMRLTDVHGHVVHDIIG